MGFYPLNPVSNDYQLTSPLFERVTLKLKDQKVFEIIAHRKSPGDVYIAKVLLNGKTYRKNVMTYQQLMSGGKLEIWLKNTPD